MRPTETVGRYMRRKFIKLEPWTGLVEAAETMRVARVRHLPVADADQLVGVISHRDLMEVWFRSDPTRPLIEITDELSATPVAEHMRSEPWSVTLSTSLREAADRMLRLRVGCLPVVDGDGQLLVGLITERDLLRAAYMDGSDSDGG